MKCYCTVRSNLEMLLYNNHEISLLSNLEKLPGTLSNIFKKRRHNILEPTLVVTP